MPHKEGVGQDADKAEDGVSKVREQEKAVREVDLYQERARETDLPVLEKEEKEGDRLGKR